MVIGSFGIKDEYEYRNNLVGKNVITARDLYIFSNYDPYKNINLYYAMENDSINDRYGRNIYMSDVVEVGTKLKVIDDTYKYDSKGKKSNRILVVENDKITFAIKSSEIDKYFIMDETNYGRIFLILLLIILIFIAFYLNMNN